MRRQKQHIAVAVNSIRAKTGKMREFVYWAQESDRLLDIGISYLQKAIWTSFSFLKTLIEFKFISEERRIHLDSSLKIWEQRISEGKFSTRNAFHRQSQPILQFQTVAALRKEACLAI